MSLLVFLNKGHHGGFKRVLLNVCLYEMELEEQYIPVFYCLDVTAYVSRHRGFKEKQTQLLVLSSTQVKVV